MSDMHLHHDLYHEAASRRSREAESWVRDQHHRRTARRRATRDERAGFRVRFIALMARVMGVAGQVATQPVQRTAAPKRTP